MNVLIMGPPGAGKGTQAALMAERYGLVHLATGDILRREIEKGSELGERAREYVSSGKLVPDEIILEMMGGQMLEAARGSGFLLDGFPRTLPQAESLDATLARNGLVLDAVFNIRLSNEAILDRLLQRLTCQNCERVFHRTASPPKVEGVCDFCGGPLSARADDNRDVIEERLRVYHSQTEPVIQYYDGRGMLHDLDGDRSITEIADEIGRILARIDETAPGA